MSVWRQQPARSVYLAALAITMVGWVLALFESLKWALSV